MLPSPQSQHQTGVGLSFHAPAARQPTVISGYSLLTFILAELFYLPLNHRKLKSDLHHVDKRETLFCCCVRFIKHGARALIKLIETFPRRPRVVAGVRIESRREERYLFLSLWRQLELVPSKLQLCVQCARIMTLSIEAVLVRSCDCILV